MRTSEKIRQLGFWFSDFIKGSAILRHYKDICNRLEQFDNNRQDNIHNTYLKDILRHASINCAYYSKFHNTSGLSYFPIVNKNIIKNSPDQFCAKNYSKKKLFSVTTSGSTGTPFKTFQDRNKKNRNYADTVYFAGLAGYKIGQRLIYLKIWVASKMRWKPGYWLQNMVPVDVIQLSDDKIELLIKKMEKSKSTFGIIGYASALELICRYLDRKKSLSIETKVDSVIAISETLNDYTRTSMEKYFGVPCVSRYSNLENGIIAQQERNGSGRFLINTASYHVEILKMNSDDPTAEGELGRIVITDLFNYALPMIRYDTGDIGAFSKSKPNDSKKYFSRVEGRKLDLLYDTRGNLVSSYLVYKNMWQYVEIDQYQLIQEDAKRYTFKINIQTQFDREKQLIDEFKSYLGDDADFRIEYVSEIPLLVSGKRKKIVNNYIKN
jgi:phenylacetate-CoA ligase